MSRHDWLAAILIAAATTGAGAVRAETALESGQRLAQAGDIEGAMAAYQQAAEQDPRSSIAQTRLGGMQLLTQHYSDATRTFKTAISLDPNNADAFVGLGMGYLHLGQYSLARAALTEARARKPEKTQQIDEVIAWIDAREGAAPTGNHP